MFDKILIVLFIGFSRRDLFITLHFTVYHLRYPSTKRSLRLNEKILASFVSSIIVVLP